MVLNDYNNKEYAKNNGYSLAIDSKFVSKIASLSFDIFYEKDVINVYSSCNYLTIDSSSMFDDRIDNENGVIHVSYIFAENIKLDDGSLFDFSFNVLSTAKTNSYFSLAITSSFDQDKNLIDMKGDFDYFTIIDNQNNSEEINIYSNLDKETVKRNELFKITYISYETPYLGAGTFEFIYDREAFEFFSFEKGEFLQNSSMYSTVNTNIEGSVKISFACMDMNGRYTRDLFSIQLKVKANVDKDWNLKLEASGLTSKDGNTKYTAPVVENKITTVYEQDKSLLPLMYLTSKKDEENKKLYITLSLEESSHLSAADIVITIDPSILFYQSYNSLVATLEDSMLGVNPINVQDSGTIKVSWVYLKDLTQKVDFAQFTFDILDVVVDTTTSISLNATGTRDSNLKEVDLAYQGVDVSLNINKHNWSDWETVNPATCAKDGLAKRTCSLCNKIETKVLPKTGIHFYGDWIVDKEPTCTEEGSKHKTCSVCGDTVTETIAALGHDYHSQREDATCTKDGYVVEVCSRCGDERNRTAIAAKGHSYGEWITDKEPTCAETGKKHKICSECGDVVIETLNALGHDLVHHDAKAPTCTESGYDAYDTCTRCSYSTYVEIPALGHDEGKWAVVRDADCTHDGLEERRCTRCGEVLETRNIDATGHSYGDWVVDKNPTCTGTGTRHKTCFECGDVVTETLDALGHDLVHHDVKEPTCTESGHGAYDTCIRCGYSTYVEIPAKGHSYGEWITDKEPTCTETVTKHKICSDCGDVVVETIYALGHNIIHHDAKTPTCTESGHEAYDTCSRCGYSTYHEIPKLGHDEGKWTVVRDADCTHDGLEERRCTRCGELLESRSVDAKRHSYGDWIVDKEPTCTESGSRHKVCSHCGDVVTETLDALGHDLVHHDAKAPTCTENGYEAYDTCTKCSYSTYKGILATGHSYDEWIVDKNPTCTETGSRHKTCSECGDMVTETLDALGHDYHSHREEATCTKDGYVVDICSRCGSERNKEIISAKGHSYGDWIVDKDPTCTETGTRHKVCSECDDVVTETLGALGHDLVHHDGKDPTCTENGHEAYDTCSRCGYSTYHEIPALGHDEGTWVVVKNPTCTEDGHEERRCTRCGKVFETRTITATGHSYGDWIVDKNPTCTEIGTRHKNCSNCDDVVTETLDALGHDLVHHDAKASTCTETGYDAYDTCTRCGYSTYHEIPALGHDEGKWTVVKDADCTHDGLEERRCTRCGELLESRTIDAKGHSYGEWTVDKAPTCTETGARHRTCSECGDVITENIGALGHDYHSHREEPTCTKDGYVVEICSRCGDERNREILPAKGHSYGDWIIDKDPTCTESGSRHKTCSECGDVVTETVDALGHDIIHHDAKDPTCTESGYEAYDTCSRCDYSTYNEIPALGHDEDTWVVVKNPTCTEDGLEERRCTRCGKVLETRIITAKGHSYGDWIVDKDATCTENGSRHKTCSECGDVINEIIDALGHDLVHHDVKAPTCTEGGQEAYDTCTRCGYSTYHEILKLGHDEGKWTVVRNADCTHDGLEERRCTRCGELLESRSIDAKGHSYGDWIVDKEPTCTESGSRHKVCSHCGDVVTETLDALGHDIIHHDAKAPACTESGHNAYDTCTRCGYSTYKEIPATGHSYGECVVDKDATCIESGTRHKTCSVCGDTIIETVDALGHDLVRHDAKTPTCTENGYGAYDTCSRCGYSTYHEIPAAGHSYGDWVVVKEPTSSSEGLKTRTCSICGDTETVVIPKLQKKNNVGVIAGGCVGGVAVLGCSILIPLLIKKKKKKSDK